MKKIRLGVLLLIASVGVDGQVLSQETAPSSSEENIYHNTLEEKIYALSLLWSEIKYNFAHIDRLTFDVDSLYRTTMQRVVETKDDLAFYDELQRFMAAFNDGHTQLISGTDAWEIRDDYPPYATALFGDKFYFTTYKLNCPDTDPKLLGAEIIEVEGMPVMEYVHQKLLPKTVGSTERYKLNVAGYQLLNGPVNTYIDGKARTKSGEVVDFHIIRNGEATRTPEDRHWKPANQAASDPHAVVDCRWIDRVALLTIHSFADERVADLFDSALAQIKAQKPRGLIIDLRRNGGGITEVAWRLQMHLTDADSMLTFGAQTRTNLGYGRAQGNYREEYADYYQFRSYVEVAPPEYIARNKEITPVDCPTVILIGPYSFSACEDFLVNIYEIPGRSLLVGEQTGGSSGAPLVINLPHDACARICTLRMLFPYSGKPFVGGGIQPDIEVRPTIDDYLSGVDTTIVKALEELHIHSLKNN